MGKGTLWSQCLFAAMLLCPTFSSGGSNEPLAVPILRIEAGMHTAGLNRIATDRAGRYAVTVGDDKTARIWEVASGNLLHVLRPPIGDGHMGKLFAAAITPDGSTVAVGGWTRDSSPHDVYLFDRASGQLKQRLTGLSSSIMYLTFNADGRLLAAMLGRSEGVRVWDWRSSSIPLADTDVEDDSYSASWSPDNRLATTSLDGRIRLYRVQSDKLVKLKDVKASGNKPHGIAFSPDGAELAVGYRDNAQVDILDGKSLILKFAPTRSGLENGYLSSVAWSTGGEMLYAAGNSRQKGHTIVRRWPNSGRGEPVDVLTNVDNVVMSLLPLSQAFRKQGGILVGGKTPAWGVIDAADVWHSMQPPPIADLRGSRMDFKLSIDGREVQFGFENRAIGLHHFALRRRLLTSDESEHLNSPRVNNLPIANWRNTLNPTLAGKPIKLGIGEFSRSLAIAPDNRSFVLGGDFSLRRVDANGKQLWRRATPGVTWGVNISISGEIVVAAFGDGTIRWHRLSDGQELLNFFPHADRRRWVLWTPSGYYDASPGGEDLIGWHVNRGEDLAADFFPASRFRDRYWRPDIIDGVLDTYDEGQAITAANAARGTNKPTVKIKEVLPPVIELVSSPELSTSQALITLRYRTRSAANAPVIAVRARVNGQAQPDARNFIVQPAADVREITVMVPPKDSQVQLFAESRHGISTPASVRVTWKVAATTHAEVPVMADAESVGPKLYVLAIGVSNYQHKDIPKLSYAAKDAQDFAAAMWRQKGKLYKNVELKIIPEADATRDNIVDALGWLEREVTQHDVGMLFLSGHGYNHPSMGYTFLPVNSDPDRMRSTLVTMADIRSALSSMPGKVLAFLDTCHSGNIFGPAQRAAFFDIGGVLNELASAENGVVVFSSSTGRQFSLEDKSWNNGAFTKALVEGIDGKADIENNGYVTHKDLDRYVTKRVKEITKGLQSTVTQAPGGVNDFPVAVVAR